MSLDTAPSHKPLVATPAPTWGEIAGNGEKAVVVRFILAGRVVTFPASELKRWEHVAGEPETLMIAAGRERIVIEGGELNAIRAALDLQRLAEVRTNYERTKGRPGPRVRRIAIESP